MCYGEVVGLAVALGVGVALLGVVVLELGFLRALLLRLWGEAGLTDVEDEGVVVVGVVDPGEGVCA